MRFNGYISSHFAGCRLLHVGRDPHRGREARYFAIPGEFGLVGYSDATDAFVIPVSEFVAEPVRKALRAIEAGEDFQYAPPTRGRRRPFASEPAEVEHHRRVFHG